MAAISGGDFGAQQVAAHARLGPLADLDLDRIAGAEVIGRDAPAAGGPLDDQVAARLPALERPPLVFVALDQPGLVPQQPALAGVVGDARLGRADGQRHAGFLGQRAVGHAGKQEG